MSPEVEADDGVFLPCDDCRAAGGRLGGVGEGRGEDR